MDNGYLIRVIGSHGPGEELKWLPTESRARQWIDRTGIAFKYFYGVAIQRVRDGMFDCGDGVFMTIAERWPDLI